MWQPRKLLGTILPIASAVAVIALNFCLAAPTSAEVIRQDDSDLGRQLKIPVTVWSDPTAKPRAVVVAIHGMAMHGGTFDALAQNLVSQGFLVAAPDLRGYGRWQVGAQSLAPNLEINYEQSQADLVSLIKQLNHNFPSQPLFCVGESIGADQAIRAAASSSQYINGLVLSSPAIKRRRMPPKQLIADLAAFATNPRRQLDLTPYIRRCASEDPKVVEAMLDDPLVRKHMSTGELLKSQSFMHNTLRHVKLVPDKVPVLVIQGDGDRLLKSNAVVLLLTRLKSSDQVVRWFHERGHILLETSLVKADTVKTVQGWLVQHAKSQAAVDPIHSTNRVVADLD
jgi:alpha-beta hydrolase superfamily lysophospholipase